MAGLCEGGNEPSGSLKAICKFRNLSPCYRRTEPFSTRNIAASVNPPSSLARGARMGRLPCAPLTGDTVADSNDM
ncbi:hypothetical protein ANN_15793 [Periplaneta americana]|uniref:Uncharacterized protein n=1 Tax=Periplaneta americana TaxID=6978 RepID=A0ABQ8SHX8_PERAM|nr:hypothetical protein ANN_15793 [Periplaneta americana]